MAQNGKVTLAVLATKLDNVIVLLEQHRQDFQDHVKKDDAMGIVVDRLDQNEQRRVWHIRAIWGAIASGIIATIMGLLRG